MTTPDSPDTANAARAPESQQEKIHYQLAALYELVSSKLTPEEMDTATGLMKDLEGLTGTCANEAVMLRKENQAFRKVMRDTNELLEEKIEEISLIRLVTDATNDAIFAEDPLKFILENVIRIIGAENGSIFLLERESNQLVLCAASGQADSRPHDVRFEMGEGIAGWVAQSGKAAFINETNKDARYKPREGRKLGSLICQPLIVEKEVIGVLNVSHSDPNAFTNNTARLLYIIAGQAATAIRNAQLLEEAREHSQSLTEAEQRLMDLFEASNDAMICIDMETGQILRANEQAHKYTGYSRAELAALKLEHLFRPEHASLIRGISSRRRPRRLDAVALRRIDGEMRLMELKTWCTEHNNRQEINIVCRDMSESERLRLATQELASQRDFLVQLGVLLERNSSPEEFLDTLVRENNAAFASLHFLSGKNHRLMDFLITGKRDEEMSWLRNGMSRLVREDTPWSRALVGGCSYSVENLSKFPTPGDWMGWLRQNGVSSLVCIPFPQGESDSGLLCLYYHATQMFTPARLDFYNDLIARLARRSPDFLKPRAYTNLVGIRES